MWRHWLLVLIAFILPTAATAEGLLRLQGTCMGTTYAVTITDSLQPASLNSIQQQVSDELERIEQIFSLYRANSELNCFNAAANGGWIRVSSDLLAVAKRAIELANQTDGAFDPTVSPLIRLWRLRQIGSDWSPPSAAAIAKTRQRVGFRYLDVRDDPRALRKLSSELQLDLNALAEGWAIDHVVDLLRHSGVNNALVELGGEFRALGQKADGQPWRIGIENPLDVSSLYATAVVDDAACATSGNYRQVIEHHGRRYGHIFDARTGAPVQHTLLSVSVIADDAATADGWATALMVLGPTEGFALAEKNGFAASFASRGAAKVQIKLTKAAVGKIILINP
jgi:FAD:protein FMN transferase